MPPAGVDIPDQTGRLALITGATGGLGYETALALARAGATVLLTGRNADKGAEALARIRAVHPRADIGYRTLDVSELASVATFADDFARTHDRLDLLVNNAGVMALPHRQQTADGFERQFATNYLGHFALTLRLLPLLTAAGGARVVSLSSIAARTGRIYLRDLQATRHYWPWMAYGQSKLACLMFAFELQRRSDAAGLGLTSLGAHPGVSGTLLIENGLGVNSLASRLKPLYGMMLQSPEHGAWPLLYAAISSDVTPGGYYGPSSPFELWGTPAKARPPRRALDSGVAGRLWDASEELTGTRFPAP